MMMNMTVKPVKVTEMTKEETLNTLIFPFQNSILKIRQSQDAL